MTGKRPLKKMAQDVLEGLDDQQLMAKYHLSYKGLENFYDKALNIGILDFGAIQTQDSEEVTPDSPNAVRHRVSCKIMDRRVGLQDIPSSVGSDLLDNDRFAAALGEFILRCDTPTTIAVQGDWGSGKSTLLNLIQGYFDSSEQEVLSIEFNCWDCSQFGAADDIPIFLMIHFTKAIENVLVIQDGQAYQQGNEKLIKKNLARKDQISKIRNFAWGLTKGFAGNLSRQLLMGVNLAELVATSYQAGKSECAADDRGDGGKQENGRADSGMDYLDKLGAIKDGLKNIVNDYIVSAGASRIVIFIDDLDRLAPLKAVELLEAIKTFLDIKGCVFIVACDQAIVSEGIKAKFPGGLSSASGKSFLDKIFQLSVNMPTGKYNIKKYLGDLLTKAKFDYPEQALDDFLNLLKHSVGFNPRNVKRLVNSLILLRILEKPAEETHGLDADSQLEERKQKILFGIGCMQSAFNSVYQIILENLNSDEAIVTLLQEELREENNVIRLGFFREEKEERKLAEKLCKFMDVFFRTLDTGEINNRLDREEIGTLREAFRLMSITSETLNEMEDPSSKRKAIYKLFYESKKKAKKLFEKGPSGGNIKLQQPESDQPFLCIWPKQNEIDNNWVEGLCYFLTMDTRHFDNVTFCLHCNVEKVKDEGIQEKTFQEFKTIPAVKEHGYNVVHDTESGQIRIQKEIGKFKCSSEEEITSECVDLLAKEMVVLYKSVGKLFERSLTTRALQGATTVINSWQGRFLGAESQNQTVEKQTVENEKRKISPTDLANDIISGASEQELLIKYEVNGAQLKGLVKKLLDRKKVTSNDCQYLFKS